MHYLCALLEKQGSEALNLMDDLPTLEAASPVNINALQVENKLDKMK
jgi:hypothetical protein